MKDIEQIQQTLIKRIAEARQSGAEENSKEIRTSRAALKALRDFVNENRV